MNWQTRFRAFIHAFQTFPWRSTAAVLRERFREDRLGLTASSLTFTTTIALVPFMTVALAVFTAFPMFAKMQGTLQQWLVESLIPESIARNLLGYLTQFASKASRLGVVGLVALLVTALALILTIDRTLNNIWRVKQVRPFAQRVLVYWAAITLGPILLATSLTITSYVLGNSKGVVGVLPGGLRFLLDTLEFALLAAGMAALFHYVPNTRVRWAHAWVGGVFAALGIQLAKKLLAVYISAVPTYSAVYGTFATAPILLLWIYIAWVIVLLGAVITAYLPSLLQGVERRGGTPGWAFQLCIETLQVLNAARSTSAKGLTIGQISAALKVESLQLEPVLETLTALDYAGEIADTSGRFVLLCNPEQMPMQPIIERLLLAPAPQLANFEKNAALSALNGRMVL